MQILNRILDRLTGKTVKVKVTAEHIRLGAKRAPAYCPIALALKEAGYGEVTVGGRHAIMRKAEDVIYMLPEEAQEFVSAFDQGLPVKPLKFVMKKNPWPGSSQY